MTPKLIGPAGVLEARLAAAIAQVGGPLKLLFWGEPGVGKSEVSGRLARMLTHEVEIERVNGADVGVDQVREWAARSHCSSLFANWSATHTWAAARLASRASAAVGASSESSATQRTLKLRVHASRRS